MSSQGRESGEPPRGQQQHHQPQKHQEQNHHQQPQNKQHQHQDQQQPRQQQWRQQQQQRQQQWQEEQKDNEGNMAEVMRLPHQALPRLVSTYDPTSLAPSIFFQSSAPKSAIPPLSPKVNLEASTFPPFPVVLSSAPSPVVSLDHSKRGSPCQGSQAASSVAGEETLDTFPAGLTSGLNPLPTAPLSLASSQDLAQNYQPAPQKTFIKHVFQECLKSPSKPASQWLAQPESGKGAKTSNFTCPSQEKTPLLHTTTRSGQRGSRLGQVTQTRERGEADSRGDGRYFGYTRRQLTTLSSMMLVDFFSFASISIMAPFFPYQVHKMGLSSAVDGVIFSVFSLALVIASPLIGKFLPLMNLMDVYLGGVFLTGLADVCFGLVSHVGSAGVFLVVSVCLRVLTGIGSALYLTVIYSIVPVLFPGDTNTVNGVLETVSGLGMCVGPAVGAWLYSEGGFSLPFFCLGGFILFTLPGGFFAFPSDELRVVEPRGTGNVWSVLGQTGVAISLLILFTAAVCLAVLYPTLQPHMSKLGVSVEGVGLVYLILSAAYAVSSPLVGLATDRFGCSSAIMLLGLLLTAVAYILIGNSPLLPHLSYDKLYNQDVVGIVLLGLASAMCIVPTYGAILKVATRTGEVDISIYSIVGGLWSAIYSLGEMLGPIYGGMMMSYVTFATSTTLTALLPVAVAIVMGTYMCVTWHS